MGAAALEDLIARLGSRIERASQTEAREPSIALGWPEIDALLPDGGLPRGVVELAAPHALGGSTQIALHAIAAAHARSKDAWCAWIDPEATLYAPGVLRARVDLARLLVVRPPRADIGRIAVKVAASGAFDVVVADMDPIAAPPAAPPRKRALAPEVVVRKLAIAAEQAGSTVILVTNALAKRSMPWPVALRLELSRPAHDAIHVRVAKDRRGRIGLVKTVPFAPKKTQRTEAG
jgi:hypothetical protein